MLGKVRSVCAAAAFGLLGGALYLASAQAQQGGEGTAAPGIVLPEVNPNLPVIEPPLPSVDGSTAPLPSAPALTAPSGVPPLTVEGGGGTATPGASPAPAETSGDAGVPEAVVPATASARRFQYAFRLALSTVYDDNVNLRGRESGGAFYFTVEPGVTVGYGDIIGRATNYVRLDYAPSLYLYTTQSEANALQHLIRAEGQYLFSRVTATLSQDVQILDGSDLNVTNNTGTTVNRVNLDVSGRTRVNIYVTRASFSFALSDKSAVALALLYNNNAYRALISSQTISNDLSYNYTYSPKLTLSLALSSGYLSVEGSNPSQTFEQLNLRATYQTSGKVAVNGSVGLEIRQFEGSSDNNVTPVLELGVIYQPFDGTTLTLSANRRVLSSATLAATDYTTTGFVVSLRQRLFQRYFANLTFGYENSSYFSTTNGRNSSRQDDYLYVQPSLEYRIRENWSASAFYVHRQNVSSGSSGTGFSDNQAGLRTSYNF